MASERLTGALVERLTHRGYILDANGGSSRLPETDRPLKGTNTIPRKEA